MRLSNLKHEHIYKVRDYIVKNCSSIKENSIESSEIYSALESSPYTFMRPISNVKPNFLWRLSILLMPIVFLILLICFIPNYIITGSFGYSTKNLSWYLKWRKYCKIS